MEDICGANTSGIHASIFEVSMIYSTLLGVAFFKSQEMEREFCRW